MAKLSRRMKSEHPLAGSPFLDRPLEHHVFTPSRDEYLCATCLRPRAMHHDDGVLVWADTPWRPSQKERKECRDKGIA